VGSALSVVSVTFCCVVVVIGVATLATGLESTLLFSVALAPKVSASSKLRGFDEWDVEAGGLLL